MAALGRQHFVRHRRLRAAIPQINSNRLLAVTDLSIEGIVSSRSIRAILGIHPGEGTLFILLLMANMLIGMSRHVGYSAGTALFLERYGSEMQPYLAIFTGVLAPALAATYMRIEGHLSFRNCMILSTVAQCLYLGGTRMLLSLTDANWVVFLAGITFDVVFFFSNMTFWGLAGMICDIRQAKRLFPIIGSGEWVIAALSGFTTPLVVSLIGTANMLWLCFSGALFSGLIMLYVFKRFGTQGASDVESEESQQSTRTASSPLKNPYILFMLINNGLSTIGLQVIDNWHYGILEQRYTNADQLTSFLGVFWGCVGIFILISRAFLTSRILSRFGVNAGLLALPVAVLAGVVSLAIMGTAIGLETAFCFWLMMVTRFSDACLRNDLDATAGIILYQPLPTSLKATAQALNDGIFVPVSSGIAGVLLLIVTRVFGFGMYEMTFLYPIVLILWIVSGFAVTRRYPAMVAAAIAGHRFDSSTLSLNDSDSIEILKQRLHSPYSTDVLYAMALLDGDDSDYLNDELVRLLSHNEVDVRLEAMRALARRQVKSGVPAVRERIRVESDSVVRGEALRTLAALQEVDALDELMPYLNGADIELRVSAIVGIMQHVGLDGILLAGQPFNEMRNSSVSTQRAFAARILGEVGIQNFYRPLIPLLQDTSLDVRREAIIAQSKLRNPKLWPDVMQALDIPALVSPAVTALVAGGEYILPLLETAFEQQSQNPEFQVRLVRIFQQIRGQEVLAFLERHLDVTHPDVYSRVLRALSSCQYRVALPDQSRIVDKIRDESQHTGWLMGVLSTIPDDPAFSLLKDAIEEWRCQHLDRVYLLLSFMYDSQAMFDSRNNLDHPATERRAYAYEIVDSTISRELKLVVLPLIDTLTPVERLKRLEAVPGMTEPRKHLPEYLVEIISEAGSRGNQWLVACSIFAAASIKMTECREAIFSSITRATNPLVRHTAVWALSQIDPVMYREEVAKLASSDLSLQSAVQFLERREQGAPFTLLAIEKLLILKSVPIFVEAPDHVVAQIVPILEEQQFQAGETVFSKGEVGTSMYVIVSGRVRVHIEEREIAILGERQVFGELALLDPEPRSASVTTIEPTLVFKISQNAIYDLMSNHIEIVRGIVRVLCRRIRER